jgi:two-component system sensor histidine kinase CreC
MSARNRVLLGFLLVYTLGIAFLLYSNVDDLDTRYRESAEESLVETSHLLASFVERDVKNGAIDASSLEPTFRALYARQFDARIYSYRKTRVELRAYVTDKTGKVLFDSLGQAAGEDFSRWRDVQFALQGAYGARTTLDIESDPRSSVMYVAAPVYAGSEIIGVATVGKPVESFGQFVTAARRKIITVGVVALAGVLTLAVVMSVWLVHPFAFFADYIRYVRRQRTLNLPRLWHRALDVLRTAFEEMRDALAGRHYVAEYVQALTHEIKSPLSAIRGASELLHEGKMPEADRQRFVANITRESQRIQELVDRLLELAALESRRRLEDTASVDLRALLDETLQAARAVAERRDIKLTFAPGEAVRVDGDAFLLQRALANLLENAIDFSPSGGTVTVTLTSLPDRVTVSIHDQGVGIPEYAQSKVFDKFYSLARPHSGKKSTGLGLALVQEVADLHHGDATLENAPGGGALAQLHLPRD